MSGVLMWLILCALAATVVLLPLWLRSADGPLGRGADGDEPERQWQNEKDRLVGELRDLDRAFAEGRIDAAIHGRQSAILSADAERALKRLRQARASTTAGDTLHVPRRYPVAAAAAAVLLFGISGGAVMLSVRGDIVRGTSPHADGRIPLPAAQANANAAAPAAQGSSQVTAQGSSQVTAQAAAPAAPAGMPTTADGAPDIGAMVQRLEARVQGGEPTVEEMLMLGRSYRALGRTDDAIAVLKRAAERDARADTLFAYGEVLFRDGGEARLDEAAAVFDRLLAQAPRMPEALWYKSLTLVKRHKVDEARGILRDLKGLVVGNQDATRAVGELLAVLDQVGPAMAPRPQSN
ncbi:MAG: tetratricopeptide repeat protein [Xanthobacteraceae bacterium]